LKQAYEAMEIFMSIIGVRAEPFLDFCNTYRLLRSYGFLPELLLRDIEKRFEMKDA